MGKIVYQKILLNKYIIKNAYITFFYIAFLILMMSCSDNVVKDIEKEQTRKIGNFQYIVGEGITKEEAKEDAFRIAQEMKGIMVHASIEKYFKGVKTNTNIGVTRVIESSRGYLTCGIIKPEIIKCGKSIYGNYRCVIRIPISEISSSDNLDSITKDYKTMLAKSGSNQLLKINLLYSLIGLTPSEKQNDIAYYFSELINSYVFLGDCKSAELLYYRSLSVVLDVQIRNNILWPAYICIDNAKKSGDCK